MTGVQTCALPICIRPGATAKKEGRGLVRRTEEPDRSATLAPAQVEVRTGAVLSSSGSPKHETLGAIPEQ